MVRYRDVYIEDERVLADSGSLTIDINITDVISELLVMLKCQNYATAGSEPKNQAPSRLLTKVELVDGSDVLESLSGSQAFGLAWYERGRFPYADITSLEGEYPEQTFPLYFGRRLWDKQLAFDPTRFTNPQLKVQWNLAAVHAVGADGIVSGSGRLTVIARVMEDVTKPVGFLMNKQIKSWTTASSGDESTDLPTDYPYRKIFVRPYLIGYLPGQIITNYKLSVDQDKFVPFNMDGYELRHLNDMMFGLAELNQRVSFDYGDLVHTYIGNFHYVNAQPFHVDRVISTEIGFGGQCQLRARALDGTDQNDVHAYLKAVGSAPEHMLCYPFGEADLKETWFPAPSYKSVRLICTQGTAGADASIILQQYRTY